MGPREVEKEACTDRGQTPLGATLWGLLPQVIEQSGPLMSLSIWLTDLILRLHPRISSGAGVAQGILLLAVVGTIIYFCGCITEGRMRSDLLLFATGGGRPKPWNSPVNQPSSARASLTPCQIKAI
jgi:hypothetical protein